jgi:hypothetical protein
MEAVKQGLFPVLHSLGWTSWWLKLEIMEGHIKIRASNLLYKARHNFGIKTTEFKRMIKYTVPNRKKITIARGSHGYP